MDNIVTFFKLLFFLKTTLLTPLPVSIGEEWIAITPNESFEAITGGAEILIDVSKYVKPMEFDLASKLFPKGTVEGMLIQMGGNEVALKSTGTSHGKDSVSLIVSGKEPIPTGVAFIEVRLRSAAAISSTNVYWKNGKH